MRPVPRVLDYNEVRRHPSGNEVLDPDTLGRREDETGQKHCHDHDVKASRRSLLLESLGVVGEQRRFLCGGHHERAIEGPA